MAGIVITESISLPFGSGSSTAPPSTGNGLPTGYDESLKYAHIGYESEITSSNIVASSQAAGFPVTNLSNPLTAHRWKPTALPATVTITLAAGELLNYFGIASHTLGTQECSINFQYSTNGGSSWTTIKSYSPGTNRAIMPIFSITATLWRIQITRNALSEKTDMPSLGVLYVGKALIMQRGIYQGHTPITLSRKTSRITNKTEGGQYAGNSVITEGVSTSFSWKNLGAVWVRDNFDPFIIQARSKPFFIAWRPGEFPDEVGFVWAVNDIKPTNSGPADFMSVDMDVEGYSDD